MKMKAIVFISLLVAGTWIVYGRSLGYGLIWDSKPVILYNRLLQEDFPLSSAFAYGWWELTGQRTSEYDYYRPLTTLSLMVEKKVWGIGPATLKAANILLFDLTLVLLYLFFRRQRERSGFPEIATALFAFFPLQVDIVVWEVSRGDLLMLLWGLLALLCLDSYLRKGKWHRGLASSLCYGLGIFSKEAFLFFLPLLVCYEFLLHRRLTPALHLANLAWTGGFWLVKSTFISAGTVPFQFLPGVTDNIKVIVAALGYYFRSLVFPFYHNMFLLIEQIMTPFYLTIGLSAIAVALLLVWFSRREREQLFPLAVVWVFTAGHLILIFMGVTPFNLCSRYMYVPVLGFTWILTHHMLRLGGWARYALLAVILAAFVPSVLANMLTYRNEDVFWERTYRSSPGNSLVIYKYAQTFFERGEYLEAEALLRKALELPLQQRTAIAIHFMYARIELRRADYRKSHAWLDRIGALGTDPHQRLSWIDMKSSLFLAQGLCDEAERVLLDALRSFKHAELYRKLYDLYAGCTLWEKAKEVERIMRRAFPGSAPAQDTESLARDFNLMEPGQRVRFYTEHRNFYEARRVMESLPDRNLEQELLLASLCYRSGEARRGSAVVEGISRQNGNDFVVLKRIGEMYLAEFSRLEEAILYFERSLEQNPQQPALEKKIEYLRNLGEARLESAAG